MILLKYSIQKNIFMLEKIHKAVPVVLTAFLCLLQSFATNAQNYKDPVGLTNRVYVHYTDSLVETYYYRGEKKIKTRSDAFYYWYASQDIKHTRGSFSGKILQGPYIIYYTNKDLHTKGTFKYGLKHGKWQTWYPGGEIKSREKWSKGNRLGTAYHYSVNGMLQRKRKYIKSTEEIETVYDSTGHISAVNYFQHHTLKKQVVYTINNKGRSVPIKSAKKPRKEKTPKVKTQDPGSETEKPVKVPKEKKAKRSKEKIKVQRFRQIVPGGQGA